MLKDDIRMNRRGIVLMMTLLLITVMMGIVTLVLHKNSHLSDLANRGFVQTSSLRIVNELESELPSLLSSVKTAEELDIAMKIPLRIESDKHDFILYATLSSPYTKLNINHLMNTDGTINERYLKVYMRLFELYPISDSDKFIKLILDSIDMDYTERFPQSEIGWNRPDFKNGAISDMHRFEEIIARYVALTRDKSILRIPWDKYIGFEGDRIDINAVNPETLSLILPNLSLEKARQITLYRTKAFVSKDEAVSAEPSLADVFDSYFFVYEGSLSYDLMCDLRLEENSHRQHILFYYNMLDKKIHHIEFL